MVKKQAIKYQWCIFIHFCGTLSTSVHLGVSSEHGGGSACWGMWDMDLYSNWSAVACSWHLTPNKLGHHLAVLHLYCYVKLQCSCWSISSILACICIVCSTEDPEIKLIALWTNLQNFDWFVVLLIKFFNKKVPQFEFTALMSAGVANCHGVSLTPSGKVGHGRVHIAAAVTLGKGLRSLPS